MKKQLFYVSLAVIFFMVGCQSVETNKKRKEASDYTKEAYENTMRTLDFTDRSDFDDANEGLLATIPGGQITDTLGNVVYDMNQYDFIDGVAPFTSNPSLWRQSKMNRINGLFEVKEGSIYQIRGHDLANMSLVKSRDGNSWIVIDPLGSEPTARVSMDLVADYFEQETLEVTAVIFTHSHIDHFGGIRGITDNPRIDTDNLTIYAPEGFFEESVSENVMAGNAMGRRAAYMYGNLLRKDKKGTLGTGLGQTTSTGMPGILDATPEEGIISELEGEYRTIGGWEVEFIYTPSSEAPAEMMFYFDDLQAFCQSENLNHTLHNLYTLRGAKVRNGQKWSQYIDKAIEKWGKDVQYSFGSHHWPTWGNENIVPYWEKQRDMYRFIHDQTLRLSNKGHTPREIADTLTLPTALDEEFYNRGYYGSVSHDIKAQYQLYFGWFDGNPANLNPLPPAKAGTKYVEFMGGADALLRKAKGSFDDGEYRWTAEVLNHLVFSDTTNTDARNLLADTYEQLGYMAESGPWRNFYLSGAKELRRGIKKAETPNTASPDMIQGMSNELLFNYLAMRFIGSESEAAAMDYTFRIYFTDMRETIVLIVSNGAVSPRVYKNGEHSPLLKIMEDETYTSTLIMERADLNGIILSLGGGETFGQMFQKLIDDGKASIDQNRDDFSDFVGMIDSFEFWFNIVLP